jgi:hypothetical protein
VTDTDWTTVSDGTEEQIQETKIVFEEIGDEFIGYYLGLREIRDRSSQQFYQQARFRDPETDEICYMRANHSLKEGLAKVTIGSLTKVNYVDDVDTGQASPMRSFSVAVKPGEILATSAIPGGRAVRRAVKPKPAGRPVKDNPQA